MAEEPQATAPAETPVDVSEKDAPPPPAPAAEEPVPETDAVTPSAVEEEKPAAREPISESVSFKEESNRVSDLPDPEKKALDELKQLIQAALAKHEFTAPPPKPEAEEPPKSLAEEPSKSQVDEPTKPEAEEPPKSETEETAKIESSEPLKLETSAEPPKIEAPAVETIKEAAKPEAEEPEKPEAPAAEPSEKIEEPIAEETPAPELPPEEVFIWGIPLLGDEKSDVVLLKFLRARDFKVKETFNMIKNTVRWRKEFEIEALLEEELGEGLEKVVFLNGFSKEGHPVCYNVYGEFQNKELYEKTFSDGEKTRKFLRWRIQFLEKSIRQLLDFSPGGICSFVQVTDLKNSPGPGKRELRQATNQAVNMLQDNYPEFVAKQVFVNVPWWYLAFNRMISPFLTQRTKSKFVFAGPSKSTETLFRYIAPEQVPVQYGGLNKENDPDFTTADPVTEVTIKPASTHTVELLATEACVVVWELRVPGWDVSYGAEFVPSAEDGYTVIVQKTRKWSPTDEPVLKNSFKIGDPGKVLLTIENSGSKKKKLLYRSRTQASSDSI